MAVRSALALAVATTCVARSQAEDVSGSARTLLQVDTAVDEAALLALSPSYTAIADKIYVRLRAPASDPPVEDVGFPIQVDSAVACAEACSAVPDNGCNLALWLGSVPGWSEPEDCLLERLSEPCELPESAEEFVGAYSLLKQEPCDMIDGIPPNPSEDDAAEVPLAMEMEAASEAEEDMVVATDEGMAPGEAEAPMGMMMPPAMMGGAYGAEAPMGAYGSPMPPPSSGGGDPAGAKRYEQCGGVYHTGPTTCRMGLKCEFQNEYYSQCVADENATPDGVMLFEQCGGIGYTGPTKCAFGATCVAFNEYYSQCREDPESFGMPGEYGSSPDASPAMMSPMMTSPDMMSPGTYGSPTVEPPSPSPVPVPSPETMPTMSPTYGEDSPDMPMSPMEMPTMREPRSPRVDAPRPPRSPRMPRGETAPMGDYGSPDAGGYGADTADSVAGASPVDMSSEDVTAEAPATPAASGDSSSAGVIVGAAVGAAVVSALAGVVAVAWKKRAAAAGAAPSASAGLV